jgi:hypothetical protein
VFIAALSLGAMPAGAATRVALVIGNSAYQNVSALPNPVNDASDVSNSLKRLGFEVRTLTNANFDSMRRALIGFGQQARGAEFAVIFFAGHGLQIAGENWLIPIDAQLVSDVDVANEAIGLQSLTRTVSSTTRLGLVILDACRNNPFWSKMRRTNMTRDVERGFARAEPIDNVLVAYSARDGTTARDGSGRNSPFTSSLLRNIETPGLDIRFLFASVRDDVMAETKREQQPFIYGSLSKDFVYLKMPAEPPKPGAAATPDEMSWNAIKAFKSAAVFEGFIEAYPDSPYAVQARARAEEIRKNLAPTSGERERPVAQARPLDQASLLPGISPPSPAAPISDPGMLREIRERLYELNFDPGPFDGKFAEPARRAIREFETSNGMAPTGEPTDDLLRRLRNAGELKPWGSLVYAKKTSKWGVSWAQASRTLAVAKARASCGDSAICDVELSFFGTACASFAHSGTGFSMIARGDVKTAREAALAECGKRGKSCTTVASVCADGTGLVTANDR